MSDTHDISQPVLVSANKRKFAYIQFVRSRFMLDGELKSIVITALGAAIPNAIATAFTLVDEEVVQITNVETSYDADKDTPEARKVPRISYTLQRLESWVPGKRDFTPRARPRTVKKETSSKRVDDSSGPSENKLSDTD